MDFMKMTSHDEVCIINCFIVTPIALLCWEVIKITLIHYIKKKFFNKKKKKA